MIILQKMFENKSRTQCAVRTVHNQEKCLLFWLLKKSFKAFLSLKMTNFFNPCNFSTWWCKPLIFQFNIFWSHRIHSLKKLRSTTLGCKDRGNRNSIACGKYSIPLETIRSNFKNSQGSSSLTIFNCIAGRNIMSPPICKVACSIHNSTL